jgi:hypothetical protein
MLYLILISGFIAGGSVGAYSYLHWGILSLIIPSAAALSLAVINSVIIYRKVS